MTVEQALRDALEQNHKQQFQQQIEKFRAFEARLQMGGYTIQKESFSIPLMERVSFCRSEH